MRDLRELDRYRIEAPEVLRAMGVTDKDKLDPKRNGLFLLEFGNSNTLRGISSLKVIASVGGGWDHVSVSLEYRCPTWAEMQFIAELFFKPDECAMQLHVPAKDHINQHPFVLHWWRPRLKLIPLPPKSFV
jgi:hypothetical protein